MDSESKNTDSGPADNAPSTSRPCTLPEFNFRDMHPEDWAYLWRSSESSGSKYFYSSSLFAYLIFFILSFAVPMEKFLEAFTPEAWEQARKDTELYHRSTMEGAKK